MMFMAARSSPAALSMVLTVLARWTCSTRASSTAQAYWLRRAGASAPTGYGDKGASGGSTDGSSGNSASYGGTYGGGGGSDDDDYSGAGARGGWGLVKLYYHNQYIL